MLVNFLALSCRNISTLSQIIVTLKPLGSPFQSDRPVHQCSIIFFLSTPSTSSTKIGYQDQEPSSHNNECVYWQVYMCFVRAQRISIPRIGTFRLLKTILVRLVKYRQVRYTVWTNEKKRAIKEKWYSRVKTV